MYQIIAYITDTPTITTANDQEMKDTVAALAAAGYRFEVKVIS